MIRLFNDYFHGLLIGWRPLIICVLMLGFSGLYFPGANRDSLATQVVDDFNTSSIVSNANDDHAEHLVFSQE